MIITNLLGGLGNQMFQAACGRAHSLRTGQSLKLSVDQFNGYRLHNGYEIAKVFRWQPALATSGELRDLLGWQSHPLVRRVLGRPAMRKWSSRRWVNEPHLHFWPEALQRDGPCYLHGYWQSERYFADFAAQIRADYAFAFDWDEADRAVLRQMRAGPCVSLHVRRGDYLSAKNTGLLVSLGLDYYQAALRHVVAQVPGLRCFAFSDDPEWVLRHLAPEVDRLTVVSHNRDSRSAHDMRLMSQASHHIIANSSFSWWGAWLNPSPDKIVVAPRQWYHDETRHSSRDLVPETWVRL